MTDMSIYRHDGGVYIAGEPSAVQAFSHELLAVADPRYLTYEDERITITASNGTVVYQVLSMDERYVEARLFSVALVPFVPPEPAPTRPLAESLERLRAVAASLTTPAVGGPSNEDPDTNIGLGHD